MNGLLTRDNFRESVFKRDGHKCVFCEKKAVDAHHILERRLFSDGGYYLDNGASVCEEHHLACEKTTISVEDVRHACGITKIVVPMHLYPDHTYDKWGNPILDNGNRLRGELYYDESVQKILKEGGVLDLFVEYVKYPRTYHLPFSDCISNDDRVIPSLAQFEGRRVIVTEKLDGENTSLYTNYYHARSVDSKNHPSRDRAKGIHAQFAHDIPSGWRLCCENMYAKHSIAYNNLMGYLYGFSVWNEKNECLSWDDTIEWYTLFGLPTVPVLYDGIFGMRELLAIRDRLNLDTCEGFVVRIADSFPYSNFKNVVAKYVRKDHIRTVKHWMHGQPIVPNQLRISLDTD